MSEYLWEKKSVCRLKSVEISGEIKDVSILSGLDIKPPLTFNETKDFLEIIFVTL